MPEPSAKGRGGRDGPTAPMRAVLRTLARLLPEGRRAAWIREWEAELTAAKVAGRSGWMLLWGAPADALATRSAARAAGRRHHEHGGWTTMRIGEMTEELRRAARSLMRAPGFTLSSVLALGVGLGATAAMFTLVDRVLLRPLPYPESERLVEIYHNMNGPGSEGVDWPMARFAFALFEEESRAYEVFAGHWSPTTMTLTGEAAAERVRSVLATPAIFEVLGARAVQGRLFDDEDVRAGRDEVVVVSHGLWQRRWGADPALVGRTIQVGDRALEVVGVMAEGMHLPTSRVDLWLPYVVPPGTRADDAFRLNVLARLGDGVTLGAAQAEADRLTARFPELGSFYATYLDEMGFRSHVRFVRDRVVGDVERALWILLGAVGILLIVAAANAANLFLVRTEARAREVAVRAALGARRGHLVVHFFSESLLVSAAAGVLAVGFAYLSVEVLVWLAPPTIPRLDELSVGGTTFALTVLLALATAVLLAAYPWLRFGRRAGVVSGARGAGAGEGPHRWAAKDGLVIVQVALALVLLAGSALLFRSFQNLRGTDPGFDPEGVVVAGVALPESRYASAGEVRGYLDGLIERAEALPGVERAALGPSPLGAGRGCSGLFVEGMILPEGQFPPCVAMTYVGPGYFDVLGIPLAAGREFVEADLGAPTSVIVSSNLVPRLWPTGDPLEGAVHPSPRSGPPWYPVVGVAGVVHGEGPVQPATEMVYFPILSTSDYEWLEYHRSSSVLVRTEPGREEQVMAALGAVGAELDRDVPLTVTGTLEEELARSMVRTSFTLFLLGTAATMALVLGLVGLYGVVAYRVGTRRGEIGIRMAMGAGRTEVRNMVLLHSLGLVGAGTVLGLVGAALATRLLESLLHGVRPGDPGTLALAALTLLATALAASWIPARRATRVDPAATLRTE